MNWLDIVILVILAISVFLGLKIGIIRALLSLVGLIVGIFLAGRYYIPFSERLAFIPQDKAAQVVAFIIILIGVMLIATLIAKLLTWAVSAVMLGWVNRLGGAIFGLLLGGMSCSVLLAIWVKFYGTELVSESLLAQVLLDKFPLILALLPGEFDAVRNFFR